MASLRRLFVLKVSRNDTAPCFFFGYSRFFGGSREKKSAKGHERETLEGPGRREGGELGGTAPPRHPGTTPPGWLWGTGGRGGSSARHILSLSRRGRCRIATVSFSILEDATLFSHGGVRWNIACFVLMCVQVIIHSKVPWNGST